MARTLNKLTDAQLRGCRGPAKLSDGGNLYFVADGAGGRRWLFRYRTGTRERELGLGPYPVVSLADARQRRDEARKLLAAGRDPIDEKRQAKAAAGPVVTFGRFSDEFIREITPGFKNGRHRQQWSTSLRDHASSLRNVPIGDVNTDHVLAVLRPLWLTKAETASRVRGRIERILDAAKARGLRPTEDANPARLKGHIALLLPKRPRLQQGHHPAMPYAELPAFMARLRTRPAQSARCLEMLILLVGRVSEIVGMKWDEWDRDAGLWVFPAVRMKRPAPHRVPLVPRAVELLEQMASIRRANSPWVFPSNVASKHVTPGAIDALLDRMQVTGAAPHGFRSSFRDWAGDMTDHPREVIEAALHHLVGDETERAYRRGDGLVKRRALMQDWAGYVGSADPKG